MFTSLNRTLDEARPLEHLDMLRDPVERHREAVREAADGDVAAGEDGQDRATRRIRERAVDLVERGCARAGHVLYSTVW